MRPLVCSQVIATIFEPVLSVSRSLISCLTLKAAILTDPRLVSSNKSDNWTEFKCLANEVTFIYLLIKQYCRHHLCRPGIVLLVPHSPLPPPHHSPSLPLPPHPLPPPLHLVLAPPYLLGLEMHSV
jgi:hypothetical protein